MLPDRESAALASQIARMFFDRQMSKIAIAARLGISRFTVAKLIDQALAQGLVRIEFRDVPPQNRALARTIEERWGIDLCVVASVPGDDSDSPSLLPRLASAVISDLIGGGDTVGIAWGSTLASVVRELPARSDPSISVVQLAGSSTRVGPDRTPDELARRLAERLGGVCQALFAPAFVESKELRDALLREPEIQSAVERFERIDLAVIGIGAMSKAGVGPRSSLIQSGVLDEPDIAEIEAADAVGDLVLYPFDADGRFTSPRLADRAIGITVDQLRLVPRVIAVARGREKALAIRGALETGIINVLITDQEAAELVVAHAPPAQPTTSRGRQRLLRHVSSASAGGEHLEPSPEELIDQAEAAYVALVAARRPRRAKDAATANGGATR